MSSIADNRKSRGRPPTGIGKPVGLRLYPELEAKLDAWIAAQDPKPSRPEAIRMLLKGALERGPEAPAATAPPPVKPEEPFYYGPGISRPRGGRRRRDKLPPY